MGVAHPTELSTQLGILARRHEKYGLGSASKFASAADMSFESRVLGVRTTLKVTIKRSTMMVDFSRCIFCNPDESGENSFTLAREKMLAKTLIPLIATLMAIVLVSATMLRNEGSTESQVTPPWTQATVDNPTGSYRFTTNGWEETALWRIGGEESKVKFIDHVHPLAWMLFVVLAALGLAILVSDEESVKSLWPKKVQ